MKSFIRYVYNLLVPLLPATRFFGFKRILLGFSGVNVGKNVRCVSSANFFINGSLNIGDDTWVGHEVLIIGGDADVTIGKNCDIAPRVQFVTGTHSINYSGSRIAGEGYSLPITVGHGSWICTGATILGGTNIGVCSIVSAGAVVQGEFPPNCLIGGVPARVIKELFEDELEMPVHSNSLSEE